MNNKSIGFKTCNKCDVERPLAEYVPDRRNKDGLQGICNVCRKAQKQLDRAKRMAGINIAPVIEKECNKCKVVKPAESFFVDSGIADGRATICKECKMQSTYKWRDENRDRYNENMRKYHAKHYQKFRLLRYKMTPEQHAEMLAKQNGVCAICQQPPKGKMPLAVDHNHETGAVRGLLCYGCNRALHTLDNQDLLARALRYLGR